MQYSLRLRIGLIADIHHGPSAGPKQGGDALRLLDDALDDLIRADVDVVVELGDRISDVSHDDDLRLLEDVARRFRNLNVPRFHLLGNHDVVNLSAEENRRVLGQHLIGGPHRFSPVDLVAWCPDVAVGPRGFELKAADITTIRSALCRATRPVILFCHVPISGASMVGNYYFEQYPGGAGNYWNASAARKILEERANTVLCVSGHVHWNSIHSVDGVRHLTIQSLTESFTTPGRSAATWAVLAVSGQEFDLEVRGGDPFRLVAALKAVGDHWLVPLGRDNGK